ncbi:hypothetical protein DFH07DRAFT_243110 [Mycena maculata]|uniref:Uncharacterized protein n=1 Tax=Mycena maculata TaxID=230809 RepID=A0AAD7JT46_9AGAR|nr:hypothetical protein DFH07DRAFT_243110 [Mycena maculata]
MGRWTETYYDDVFSSKLKGLVSGAIMRSKLEKGELPTISFKNFVEDLDAGDSFTTSVIQILVEVNSLVPFFLFSLLISRYMKELAERRLRSSPGDRRLIADRTAKSLRLLATPIRIYRERRGARRSVNLTDYLTSPPDEMDMEEDDDEFENLLDRGTLPVEGVRINSELYDAYGPATWAGTTTRRAFPATVSPPTPALSEDSPPPPALSPPTSIRNNVWSLPSPAQGSLALSRQPSIRRPTRSRTVDFNEFTSRRRSSTRDLRAESGGDESWARSSQATRRFFPFSYQTRRHDLHWNDAPGENSGAELSDEPLSYVTEPTPSSATFYSFPTPISSSASSSTDGQPAETSEERVSASAPRLRRGGVRPPESLLLRRVYPTVDAPQSPASDGAVEFAAPSASTSGSEPVVVDAVSYPTPGSPSNENENGTENPA